eukprot:7632669-Pyramimonas_sp.AAC.1
MALHVHDVQGWVPRLHFMPLVARRALDGPLLRCIIDVFDELTLDVPPRQIAPRLVFADPLLLHRARAVVVLVALAHGALLVDAL